MMNVHLTRCFAAILFMGLCFVGVLSAASPLEDAVALWHLADKTDANGKPSSLNVVGPVELGVDLFGEEAEESKRRGGDGKVAKISAGGYLSAGQGADGELNIRGTRITLYLRLCVPSGNWDFPIFAKYGGHGRLSYNIYSSADRLGCEFGTTENRHLLAASVSFEELLPRGHGAESWHDVIARVDGAKLELFVDGRCVDEEFMLGELRISDEPLLIGAESDGDRVKTGFEGLIDHVALWNRPLSNDEIVFLSGGREKADLRERTDRGIPGESLQYWRPPNRYFVGDTFPFYNEKTGIFHFAYLLDKGHHGAKNGFGAHQWIQATSNDLVHWTHRPFLIPVSEQWEGSICTGSVFFHENVYYAFYATRAVPGKQAPDGKTYEGEFVAIATSSDGIHFTKQSPNPLVVLKKEDGYSKAGRDPVVFQDERDGLFHMYITSNHRGKGCWAHLTSKDLSDWELQEPILAGGADPECPDWFRWGDFYYLIVNWGNGFYRVSKSPTGPWEKPAGPDILMPGAPRVPKTSAWKDGRRIITGWTNERGFGGHAVFHELIRHEDGTLGEKFVPEMLPATGPPIIGKKEISRHEIIFEVPKDYRFQAVLEFDPAKLDSIFPWTMIYYRDASNKEMIRIDPAKRQICLGSRNNAKIESVDFSSGKLALDLFVKNDVVDLCINNSRTITNTLPELSSREIRIESRPDDYRIKNLVVAPLKSSL